MPRSVIGAVQTHLTQNFVQLGAGYGAANRATQTVDDAHEFIQTFMGGADAGLCILGPSTTQLLHMLAGCYSKVWKEGAIVIAETGHEANVGPWIGLERFGIEIRWWKADPTSFQCSLEDLEELLKDGKVKLVAFPHVSNLLGEVVPVEEITEIAHRHGARVVVDGVAFAPHRPIRAQAWDVDWYVYSTYKVYGPHAAALWGKRECVEELQGPNHFFVPDGISYKFELGGPSHEACAGMLGLKPYLAALAGAPETEPVSARTAQIAMERCAHLETPLQESLIAFLRTQPVRIIGPNSGGPDRVPTISFVHPSKPSEWIAQHVNATGRMGIRNGNMYAYRLCQGVGIPTDDGVVRISMVHYNTLEEVEALIGVLEPLLA